MYLYQHNIIVQVPFFFLSFLFSILLSFSRSFFFSFFPFVSFRHSLFFSFLLSFCLSFFLMVTHLGLKITIDLSSKNFSSLNACWKLFTQKVKLQFININCIFTSFRCVSISVGNPFASCEKGKKITIDL